MQSPYEWLDEPVSEALVETGDGAGQRHQPMLGLGVTSQTVRTTRWGSARVPE